MKLAALVLFIFTVLSPPAFSYIYVAPNGNDANPGTIEQPLESLQRAQELAAAGDTVYIRGGTYKIRPEQISRMEHNLSACITYLNKSGSPGKTVNYWAYPGETPVFDFSGVKPANQRVVGIWVSGNFIPIKGIEMTGVQVTITSHTESYCIYSWGNNNHGFLILREFLSNRSRIEKNQVVVKTQSVRSDLMPAAGHLKY
jgi:hypothetical protein